VPLVNGRCTAFCSKNGYCGEGENYMEGGVNCSGLYCPSVSCIVGHNKADRWALFDYGSCDGAPCSQYQIGNADAPKCLKKVLAELCPGDANKRAIQQAFELAASAQSNIKRVSTTVKFDPKIAYVEAAQRRLLQDDSWEPEVAADTALDLEALKDDFETLVSEAMPEAREVAIVLVVDALRDLLRERAEFLELLADAEAMPSLDWGPFLGFSKSLAPFIMYMMIDLSLVGQDSAGRARVTAAVYTGFVTVLGPKVAARLRQWAAAGNATENQGRKNVILSIIIDVAEYAMADVTDGIMAEAADWLQTLALEDATASVMAWNFTSSDLPGAEEGAEEGGGVTFTDLDAENIDAIFEKYGDSLSFTYDFIVRRAILDPTVRTPQAYKEAHNRAVNAVWPGYYFAILDELAEEFRQSNPMFLAFNAEQMPALKLYANDILERLVDERRDNFFNATFDLQDNVSSSPSYIWARPVEYYSLMVTKDALENVTQQIMERNAETREELCGASAPDPLCALYLEKTLSKTVFANGRVMERELEPRDVPFGYVTLEDMFWDWRWTGGFTGLNDTMPENGWYIDRIVFLKEKLEEAQDGWIRLTEASAPLDKVDNAMYEIILVNKMAMYLAKAFAESVAMGMALELAEAAAWDMGVFRVELLALSEVIVLRVEEAYALRFRQEAIRGVMHRFPSIPEQNAARIVDEIRSFNSYAKYFPVEELLAAAEEFVLQSHLQNAVDALTPFEVDEFGVFRSVRHGDLDATIQDHLLERAQDYAAAFLNGTQALDPEGLTPAALEDLHWRVANPIRKELYVWVKKTVLAAVEDSYPEIRNNLQLIELVRMYAYEVVEEAVERERLKVMEDDYSGLV